MKKFEHVCGSASLLGLLAIAAAFVVVPAFSLARGAREEPGRRSAKSQAAGAASADGEQGSRVAKTLPAMGNPAKEDVRFIGQPATDADSTRVSSMRVADSQAARDASAHAAGGLRVTKTSENGTPRPGTTVLSIPVANAAADDVASGESGGEE